MLLRRPVRLPPGGAFFHSSFSRLVSSQKLVHGHIKVVRQPLHVPGMGHCAVLPVDNGRLIHVDLLGNPVVGHSSLRLNASEAFRKTQTFTSKLDYLLTN
nr:MAG TPA: hypothetical protein [Caudoviricetes sp.]